MSTTTTSIPLTAGRWAVDLAHTSVGFTIRHLGVSKVRGRFNVFSANVVVGNDLASTSVDASVALDSIDTGNRERDADVLAPEFLDVVQHPMLAFRSTLISALGDDGPYDIAGDATIGDVTQPLTLHAVFGGSHSVDGIRHVGFEAVADLRRKDFGIGTNIPAAMLGDIVKIELDVQLIEPQSTDKSESR